MVEFEVNIETWEMCVIVYLVFGLAPTMTILTGLVVGWLYGKVGTGWRWGLGMALVSSPAGLVMFMMAAAGLKDVETRGDGGWVGWLICAVPHVITGLVFSVIAAMLIGKRVHTNKAKSE